MSEQVLSINGRTLAYRIFGDPDGSLPLIWFHGTPAGCTPPPSLVAAAKTSGVRIIAPERPGYGDSARRPGRKIIDMVGDVEALKTHLGVDKCLIAGWSGGGPHALACGARLPGVLAVLTIAGVGPADAKDLDFLAGQGEDNVVEFHAAMKGEDALREFCTAQRKDIVSGSVARAVAALSSILSGVDLEASKGDLGVYLVELLREGLRNGIEGWVDDDLEFVLPWGFELSEIKVPVLLYQGSDDKMVPYAHGKWLADHLPKEHLRAHLIEGEGHVSLVAKGEALLSELIEAAKAASG